MNNQLAQVINTLNRIEVHGKDNLDMLLGCIMLLERMSTQSQEPSAEEESANG